MALLQEAYDIAKMGATSMNTQPSRYVFLISKESRARLLPALSPGNLDKTRDAPGHGDRRQRHPVLRAHCRRSGTSPAPKENFEGNPGAWRRPPPRATAPLGGRLLHDRGARRRPGLRAHERGRPGQGQCRVLPGRRCRPNFLINLGYGDDSKLFRPQSAAVVRAGLHRCCEAALSQLACPAARRIDVREVLDRGRAGRALVPQHAGRADRRRILQRNHAQVAGGRHRGFGNDARQLGLADQLRSSA